MIIPGGWRDDPIGRELVTMILRDAYTRWLAGEVTGVLESGFQELAQRIAATDLSLRDRVRTAALLLDTDQRLAALYGEARGTLFDRLAAYMEVEREGAAADLRAMIGDLRADATLAKQLARMGTFTGAGVRGELSTQVMSSQTIAAIGELNLGGAQLGEWWAGEAANMTLATRRAIQTGLYLGEHPSEIARRIYPTRSSDDTPAVYRQARRNATTITRTATTAVHTTAALDTYAQAGDDVSGSYEIHAVRDGRTSAICRGLDGQVFRYDDPARKEPPFHPNCRTSVLPVINYAGLGITAPRQARGTFRTYDTWLARQSTSAQDAILGPARAEAWRDGTLALRDAIDADNRVLSLDQLRDRLGLTAAKSAA